MTPAIVRVINECLGHAWLITALVLYSCGHWIGATIALCLGIWLQI
jgi:hypothetical protein